MSVRKTIVVTGASQGIGASLVRAFLDRGYNVVGTSRRIRSSNTFREFENLALVDGDIADPETAARIMEAGVDKFGAIDGLINNAGVFTIKPFVDFTLADFRQLAATNLEGFIHMTQAVVRQMLKQGRGGSIISITTPYIHHPIEGLNISVSMMTKGGIEAASKNLAMELAKDGIRVNTIAPGIVDTPLQEAAPRDFLNTLSPIRGISAPQEIGEAAIFLMEAPRITGETLNVDGGAHLGRW